MLGMDPTNFEFTLDSVLANSVVTCFETCAAVSAIAQFSKSGTMHMQPYMYIFPVVITGGVLRVVGRPVMSVVLSAGGGPGWGGPIFREASKMKPSFEYCHGSG